MLGFVFVFWFCDSFCQGFSRPFKPDDGSGATGGSLDHFIENITNPEKADNDWVCFSMFTTSTTVFNKIVKRNHVPRRLATPSRTRR